MSEKQGVAQRVIDEYSQLFRDAHAKGAYPEMKYNAEVVDALHKMYTELSAEARRVWAETKKSRDSLTDEHMGTDYYGINCAMQGMQLLAQRLGLDLSEPEVSDE